MRVSKNGIQVIANSVRVFNTNGVTRPDWHVKFCQIILQKGRRSCDVGLQIDKSFDFQSCLRVGSSGWILIKIVSIDIVKNVVSCTREAILETCVDKHRTCETIMEEDGGARHVMDTPDHHKFFELLLRPKGAHVNARFLESSDARKLACVSKTMRKIVPACELENNLRWKENGENVFGPVFTELCNICTQAGYNAATLPGFYLNVNEILSGKYLEEIELDTVQCMFPPGQYFTHAVQDISESMVGLQVGRSRKNDLVCLSDRSVSRNHGIIHRHTGSLIYRNLSTEQDSWQRSSTGSVFEIMPRVTKQGVPSNTVLQIGDYITISTGNMSTLRVNLAANDVRRLLELMHATKCRDDREHGPYNLEEAQCELELARAKIHRQAHDDFFAYQKVRNTGSKQTVIDFAQKNMDTNMPYLKEKILRIDLEVQRLEDKLMGLHNHHYALKHVALGRYKTPPAKKQALNPEFASLQAEIARLKAIAVVYARENQEQETQLEKLEAVTQCAICFEKRTSIFVFNPCHHACCCAVCAQNMVGKPCPLCRTEIASTHLVYT